MPLLIKGGRVLDPASGIDALLDVLVDAGRIVQIGANLQADADIIDASGLLVAPGLIDVHVHLREPGLEAKEDIATGTAAAQRGGFTSVCCMPNTRPVCDNRAVVEHIIDKANRVGSCRVYPIGAITKGQNGEELAEMGDMVQAGAVAVSDDGQPVMNAEVMRCALQYSTMFDIPVISHCEDRNLVGEGVMHDGPMATVIGLKGIPAAAEEVMVARDLLLAESTGARVHIAHVSTAGSVELVRTAKARGVKVTCEATPHHFTLTDEAVRGYDTSTKVNPPLRTADDVAAIKKGLADGTIDIIATDHAPHTVEEKEVEFNYAPFGLTGLETALSLVLRELVQPGVLTLSEALAKLTYNPARLMKLPQGQLTVGAPADLVLIDLDTEWVVDRQKMASKAKNTPFHGWTLPGRVSKTVVDGKVFG